VRGQSAEVVLNGGAGDVSAAVVVEYVEGQDLGGGARVEHAHREFNTFFDGSAASRDLVTDEVNHVIEDALAKAIDSAPGGADQARILLQAAGAARMIVWADGPDGEKQAWDVAVEPLADAAEQDEACYPFRWGRLSQSDCVDAQASVSGACRVAYTMSLVSQGISL